MYGLRGSRAREKTALMPDPLKEEFPYDLGFVRSSTMALWTRVVWIWTWCARGRTRGGSPQSAGLGKLGVA